MNTHFIVQFTNTLLENYSVSHRFDKIAYNSKLMYRLILIADSKKINTVSICDILVQCHGRALASLWTRNRDLEFDSRVSTARVNPFFTVYINMFSKGYVCIKGPTDLEGRKINRDKEFGTKFDLKCACASLCW